MSVADYADHDGLGLAERVRRREVSARELVEEAIARIERHDPALNSVVHPLFERALALAEKRPPPDRAGPLEGVPFLLKDILGDWEGVPTTSATRLLQGVPKPRDAELTRRYLAAGLLPLGKTNVSELGTLPTTEPAVYGPARNPWNLEHSTGGSSGGSAAAVAAGLVPIAHANDGGGSIRIPASCCGLVGLKPTRARNPLGPLKGDVMSGFVAEHVLTRSVRDSAAVLDASAGPAPGDPYAAPPPERPFLDEVGRDPGRLRIGFWARGIDGGPVDPECDSAVAGTARLLEGLGHHVEEARFDVEFSEVAEPFTVVWAAGTVAEIDTAAAQVGREPKAEDFEPANWSLYEIGRSVDSGSYLRSITRLQEVTRRVAAFFDRFDAWISPTLARPPVRLGEIDGRRTWIELAGTLSGYVPFTPIFNATGQPAVSLPLHWSAEGLPVGVQVAGRFGDEGLLFRLASQLEQAQPWRDRRPPVWSGAE